MIRLKNTLVKKKKKKRSKEHHTNMEIYAPKSNGLKETSSAAIQN